MKKIFTSILLFHLAVALLATGCATPASTPTETSKPTPPKSGEWIVSTEFGEFRFTVSPDGKSIPKYSYYFEEFRCGNTIQTGGEIAEREPPYLITDGQFTIKWHDYQADWDIVFQGKFDETGTRASGTWEISSEEGTCSSVWESSRDS